MIILAIVLVVSPGALAGVHNWDGGHDVLGWDGPAQAAYFAEGTTRGGFEEYLLLRNPQTDTSLVTITYSFPPPAQPMTQNLVLEAGAGASICVNDAVGPDRDVSVIMVAQPGIIAERQVYFNYKGIWTGGHASRGVAAPSPVWYFAEGTTRAGFQEWLCVQNPWDREVIAAITYMLADGQNIREYLVLPSLSRKTVDVATQVGADRDVSVMIEAPEPVVAERPMYFDYKGAWRGGHDTAGAPALSREWYFAEGTTRAGFEEWLCIQNPGNETTAHVEYLFPGGEREVRDYPLVANGRTTVFVNGEVGPEKDVSIKVTSAAEIMCERPMYFNYHGSIEGGHVVIGSTGKGESWLFTATAAGAGFSSYLCLMNPGDDWSPVAVEIFGDGDMSRRNEFLLGPHTRHTIDLNAESAGMGTTWVKVSGASGIVAERPTYFTYEPKVVSDSATFATWNGVELKSPIRYPDLLGCIFHEASAEGSDGKPNGTQALQPVGQCMRDDNPAACFPGVNLATDGDPAYFIEESRSRGNFSTTACDVQSKAGAEVLSPVDGTVLAAESYLLYGKYPDLRVKILIDGHPGYHVAVLHMASLAVSKGQRVEAGKTVIGTVRDLVPYFHSGPNDYTREEGNHAHIQINYRPDVSLSSYSP